MLLRGVNVGGRHKVAMAELRALLADAGFADVATYVQSGNVVLSGDGDPDAIGARVAERVSERFGFDVPVAARAADELDAVLRRDPLPDAAQDPKHYVVTFLPGAPDATALGRLTALAVDGERLHAEARELYTHHPQGQGRSKLAAALTGPALSNANMPP